MIHLSIISPVYGAEKLLYELVERIKDTASQITDSYEIILVEDCSPDNCKVVIKELCSNDQKIKGIFLSRNFGQQYALNSGLDYAQGEWVVTLDCDLQDNPAEILKLYKRAMEGYDIVFASRISRKDTLFKKISSKYFNILLGYLTETKRDNSIANFVLYNRKAVLAMKNLGDYHRYYPYINQWIGFNIYAEPITHNERKDGIESSYSISKRLKLAIATIISFSDKPLRLIIKLGILIVIVSFIAAILLIINYFLSDIVVSGWLTTFVSLWFIAGIIILLLGIIGIYIGKIFESVKHRPTYIVSEVLNIKENE